MIQEHYIYCAFYFYFLKIIFNWRMIALQYWFDFCHTSTWISHRCTYVPSLLNLPPTSLFLLLLHQLHLRSSGITSQRLGTPEIEKQKPRPEARWETHAMLLSLHRCLPSLHPINHPSPIRKPNPALAWWRSAKESACQCRRRGKDPWSGKVPCAVEQLSSCATTMEPAL